MHKNTWCRKFALQCSNLKCSCNISRLCFRIVYRLEDEFLHFIHFLLWAFSAEKEEWEILLFRMGCIRYNVSKRETGEQVIARVSVCDLRRGWGARWSWKDSELCTLCSPLSVPANRVLCRADLFKRHLQRRRPHRQLLATAGYEACKHIILGWGHWFSYLFTWCFS